MNIPNTITILRVMLVPVLAYLLLHGDYRAALWVLLAAGISDFLDGFIARRFNLLTYLGSVLDPVADKFLIMVSAFILAWIGLIPWWLTAVIMLRDFIIIGGAICYFIRAGGIEMNPSFPSKLNTLIQTCLILMVLGDAAGILRLEGWLPTMFGCALFTTVFSGLHYIVIWGKKGAGLKTKADR